jgi:hypothetical protein
LQQRANKNVLAIFTGLFLIAAFLAATLAGLNFHASFHAGWCGTPRASAIFFTLVATIFLAALAGFARWLPKKKNAA